MARVHGTLGATPPEGVEQRVRSGDEMCTPTQRIIFFFGLFFSVFIFFFFTMVTR